MLLIDGLLFQIAILAEICIKCVIFIEKLQKSPSPPMVSDYSVAEVSAPRPSSLRIPGYATGKNYKNVGFVNNVSTK